MIRIGLIAALAVLVAASAFAQMQRVDPAVPSALPESRVEPASALGTPAPPQLSLGRRRAGADADARHCLTLATNKEVHRCSLRYRSHAARAAAAKAPKRAAVVKTAEPMKPPAEVSQPTSQPTRAPRAGDAAKAAEIVKPMDLNKSAPATRPVDVAPKPGAPTTPTAPAKSAPPAKSVEPAKK